ncbi:hypothetical protein [Bradyrhizobium sp.]|uniref:hypothetical protein n=1 Tax=Bradyrhizobium sp. TaxID=376 RepID=UPI003C19B97B
MFEGLKPELSDLRSIRGPRKTSDRGFVAMIQRLVQQFSDQVVLSSAVNAITVQRMIRRGPGGGIAELDEELTQFGRRQACADDRAMQRGGDIPDLRSPALCVGDDERRRTISPAKHERADGTPLIVVGNREV